ncbi:hypothetical protein FisN_3Hh167 [Fistulifera solaris]|uniref:Palmitoyltransferase n=1 Tax=Fistulifera solaris TaxID=1519565 RepID=A0A1Z5JNT0_FISSO|nr:hypothetical protein FisN_3Hh167 [Fistulifera solaris]|eukprot:GAX15693.1 hypothetical protein FisN_3Hh167 [Fistulifera solaris]
MPQRRAAVAKDRQQVGPESREIISLSLEGGGPRSSVDDPYDIERHNMRVQQWHDSPFAVGLTEPTWWEESRKPCKPNRAYGDSELERDHSGCLCCSAWFCSRLGAQRVGNMSVLKSTEELVEEVTEDEESGEIISRTFTRPVIQIVVGPFWPMLMLITYPLIFAASWYTFKLILKGSTPYAVILLWALCTVGLVVSLALTACTDPGILYKYHKPPPQDESTWRWTDQAVSYRPRRAQYDPDCAVVVEGFDHTCPWTGTAIGKKNMPYFQCFVCLVFICIFLDLYIVTLAI